MKLSPHEWRFFFWGELNSFLRVWVQSPSTQVDKVWIFIWKPPCFHHRHLHDVCIHFFVSMRFFCGASRKREKINCIMDICDKGVVFLLPALFSFSQSSLIPPTYDSTQFSSSLYFFTSSIWCEREKFRKKSCDAMDCFIFTAWWRLLASGKNFLFLTLVFYGVEFIKFNKWRLKRFDARLRGLFFLKNYNYLREKIIFL